MKVAYICHHGRPTYGHEQAWFAAMPVEKIRFITTEPPPLSSPDDKIEYCQVPYRDIGFKRLFTDSTARRVIYDDFERYLEDIDVVVVLEAFSSLSRQFIEYCHSVGKPVAVLVYELIAEHPIYRFPGYRANTQLVVKRADLLIAVSHAAANHLLKLGAPASKVQVVYPGVDTQLFQVDTTHRDPMSLILVGPKLGPHKGVDLVIELYRRLIVEFPNLRLTVVGKGGLEPEVRELAQQYSGVTLSKPVPNSEVPALLNRHGIFITPARDTKRFGLRIGAEQFGFSFVEAMSCGLAIITADCGALAEIVTSNNIVCRQGDIDDLYDQTRQLLLHADRIAAIGQANRKLVVERYSLPKQGAALANALEGLVARYQKGKK